MKKLILFYFLAFPFLIFAQSRSSIDFMFSPDLTYRNYNAFNQPYTQQLFDSIDKPNIGFHTGINYNRKVSRKIYLSGGVHLSKMGYSSKMDNLVFPSDLDSITGLPISTHTVKLSYDFYLISFPLELRYDFNDRNFSPYLKIGISPTLNMYSYIKSQIDIEDERTQKNNYQLNHLTALLQIGFGANFKLNDKWQIFAQPTFRYQLTKIRKEYDSNHLYSIGIELGARMSL